VAMFVKSCSAQQKMMMAAVVRCVRREGIPEITWRSVSGRAPVARAAKRLRLPPAEPR
jgi:hypothetical protein